MIAFQYGIENKNKKNNMKLSTKINSIRIFLVFYIRLVAILYDCTFLRLIAFSLVRRADSTSVHTPCVMHYCVFVYTCYCKKKKFSCVLYIFTMDFFKVILAACSLWSLFIAIFAFIYYECVVRMRVCSACACKQKRKLVSTI